MPIMLVGAINKNPKSIIWDILVIFNIYMHIKDSFCREFKYLQYNYIKIYSLSKNFQMYKNLICDNFSFVIFFRYDQI